MYHQVGIFSRPKEHRATYCHIRRFTMQMAYLHQLGYQVISLDEAFACLTGERPMPRHAVVLTFDDGYQNFFDYAFPVLARYRFPATVFLVAGLLGKRSSWLTAAQLEESPLMNVATIRNLNQQGITFGAHSLSHQRLSDLDSTTLIAETRKSKMLLESQLEMPIRFFCYPYGDFNQEVVDAVAKAGFNAALTCNRGDAGQGDNMFLLPRKAISFGDSLAGFIWKLHRKSA